MGSGKIYGGNVAEKIKKVEEPQLTLSYPTPEKRMRPSSKPSSNELNVLSLFSGCGGMDIGFEGGFTTFASSVNETLHPRHINKRLASNLVLLSKNRFKTVFANDILDAARLGWTHYFTKKDLTSVDKFFSESIVDLVKLHRVGINKFPHHVDVVTGGFPCQDFSVAGKRNGFDSHKNHKGELITHEIATEETRGKLYMWMKEVIEITSPNIFIAENVKGLVNLANVKEIIQNDFSGANGNGYIVLEPQVLHAADYGVPQSRERVIFIGIKKAALNSAALAALSQKDIPPQYNPYPAPTHAYTKTDKSLKTPVALSDILGHLPEPEHSDDLSHKFYSKAKFMGKHCQGQTEVNINSISPTIRAEHHGNIEFRRLAPNNGGKYVADFESGKQERRLTPRECALIQTFPPDYEFVIQNTTGNKKNYLISPSQAYKIIGNAVPPMLAYNIAKRIEYVWDLYFKQ